MDHLELSAISEELEVIKQHAHHEGYELAITHLEATQKKINEDLEKLANIRDVWNRCLASVRSSWSEANGKSVGSKASPFGSYEPLFGHTTIDSGRPAYFSVNMPIDIEEFTTALLNTAIMGRDFQKILKEIKSNPILESQWNKLLMSMKLVENKDGQD